MLKDCLASWQTLQILFSRGYPVIRSSDNRKDVALKHEESFSIACGKGLGLGCILCYMDSEANHGKEASFFK